MMGLEIRQYARADVQPAFVVAPEGYFVYIYHQVMLVLHRTLLVTSVITGCTQRSPGRLRWNALL